MKNQPTLQLPSVFWKAGIEDGLDAVAYVEDAVVIYIEAVDVAQQEVLQVRLLMHELEALYSFAQAEVERQEAIGDTA